MGFHNFSFKDVSVVLRAVRKKKPNCAVFLSEKGVFLIQIIPGIYCKLKHILLNRILLNFQLIPCEKRQT